MESLLTHSSFAQVGIAFSWGILSVATPCVFPLIPITLAVVGATQSTRVRAFVLSLLYVLGMSTTYTILGMIAAKSGGVFGSMLGKPWIVALLVIFLFFLALSSIEIFQLNFLSKVQNSASKVGKSGFFGSYIMGTVSGLVAAPCIGPALVVVLAFASQSQDVTWGAVILLSYSFGLGLPFLILGTFSGLVRKLPRSGNWLNFVKFFIATALLMVCLFLVSRWLPPSRILPISGPILILVGVFALYLGRASYLKSLKTARVLASLLLALTLYRQFIPDFTAGEQKIDWATSLEQAKEISASAGKPIMIDLFAEWCTACLEFDSQTFPDPRVAEALTNFVTGRINFTEETEYTQKIATDYKVLGLPSILFLKPDGQEIPNSRVEGFLKPEEFTAHLAKVLSARD